MEPGQNPRAIVVLSGKRKSGKDFLASSLIALFGADSCALVRLSEPLKGQYAKEHGLDLGRLLDSSEYKERYRVDMIKWGEDRRNIDPGYFCRLAIAAADAEFQRPLWIVSDARRKTDVCFFRDTYPAVTLTVRVEASEKARSARGWVFVAGVDDAESECGLDDERHDIYLHNDGLQDVDSALQPLVDSLKQRFALEPK